MRVSFRTGRTIPLMCALHCASKGTRVDWRYTEGGERVRVSFRTGRTIPLPKSVEDETEDFVSISGYIGKHLSHLSTTWHVKPGCVLGWGVFKLCSGGCGQ